MKNRKKSKSVKAVITSAVTLTAMIGVTVFSLYTKSKLVNEKKSVTNNRLLVSMNNENIIT